MTETVFHEKDAKVRPVAVLDALGSVIDPELGIDIVNLGMVYAITVNGGDVLVEMTLTTPGCPLHGTIRADVEYHVNLLEHVASVEVELVWDPPWSPYMMSDGAKRSLGFPV